MNLFSIWLTELKSFSIWLKELNLSCFPVWLKELNFSFEFDSQKWTFFLNMTQRIEFFEHDSKESNLPLFGVWLKELNFFFFLNMTQRIEFFNDSQNRTTFFEDDSKNRTHFFWTQHKKLNFCWKNTKITLFFEKLKKSNHFQKNMTQRIEPFFCFEKMTQKIEVFSYDSKNWTHFSICLNEVNPFDRWLAELNLFCMWHKELIIFRYDSKNWTFSSEKRLREWNSKKKSKNWTSFYEPLFNMTQRIGFRLWIWRKELNLF